MLPNINEELYDFDLELETSKNYKMKISEKHINGYADELEAMKQVVFKILNTERYEYLIYSWDYGIELQDLYGEPLNYVSAEAQRRITEALIQDDRIEDVRDFDIECIDKSSLKISFTVDTVYGELASERVVNY